MGKVTEIIIEVWDNQKGLKGGGSMGYEEGVAFCAKCRLYFYSNPPFATLYLCPYCGTPLRHKSRNRKRRKKK